MERIASAAPIRRWMYGEPLAEFFGRTEAEIIGELTLNSGGNVDLSQLTAWSAQIALLRKLRAVETRWPGARIYFEYTIPRLGRRADVLLIVGHVLFVFEFKVGEHDFTGAALDQVWDYALDMKHFHDASHDVVIAPVLVATTAVAQPISWSFTVHGDRLLRPARCGAGQLLAVVESALGHVEGPVIDADGWERGRYLPTPTIIEAARALYAGHRVESISRSDAGAVNLARTAKAVESVIASARTNSRKAICLVTGVPGAGKTLVGLDVANRHSDAKASTYSVFLSGNGPLVAVLREALTRDRQDKARREGTRMAKSKAREGVEAFIQNVHHFRDDCLSDRGAPPEHVVLFDEAQRAWTLEQTSAFMQRRKGHPGFDQSEPEFLISCLDRHADWAVVVCLVGGGQEINTGEAGISEWLTAILKRFRDWEVHISPELGTSEYRAERDLVEVLKLPGARANPDLHLSTSMRSFRAETLSSFVREVLDLEVHAARKSFEQLRRRYPIVLTRRLDLAKRWLREQARGSERFGIVVSSQAERLKPHAIDVRIPTDPVKWFLDGKNDVRSSYYLEEVATEFVVQGLELDWACVVWDGDLRRTEGGWSHHQFRGSRWNRVKKPERQRYLENAYRVLMTRARQGMVIVVPDGDDIDATRDRSFYDPTYAYLSSLGLLELSAGEF